MSDSQISNTLNFLASFHSMGNRQAGTLTQDLGKMTAELRQETVTYRGQLSDMSFTL